MFLSWQNTRPGGDLPVDIAELLCPPGAVWPSVLQEGPPQAFCAVAPSHGGGDYTLLDGDGESRVVSGGGGGSGIDGGRTASYRDALHHPSGRAFDTTALDASLRWCASMSWSGVRMHDEQMALGDVYDAMLTRCEPLETFYRCGE